MTSDLDWVRFHKAFGDDPGVLPDGEVLGSTEHDWDAVFTMLHRSGWKLTASNGHSPLPPNRHGLAEFESLAVWPVDGVRINFFPGPDAVIFDVDLRELIDQASVDGVARVMRKLGTTLHRDVVIRDEGTSGPPVLRYCSRPVFTGLNARRLPYDGRGVSSRPFVRCSGSPRGPRGL